MAVKPIYAEKLTESMCCHGAQNDPELANKIADLEGKISEQELMIKELKQALDAKVGHDELVTVYSLEDEELFRAIPLES